MGRVGPHVTAAIRGQPSLKAEPICPSVGSLPNFATGPLKAHPLLSVERDARAAWLSGVKLVELEL